MHLYVRRGSGRVLSQCFNAVAITKGEVPGGGIHNP